MCDSAGARAAAAGGERSARAAMRRSDETACAGTPRGAPARACAGVSCELSPRGVRSAQTPLGGPRTTGGRSESRQRAVLERFSALAWRARRGNANNRRNNRIVEDLFFKHTRTTVLARPGDSCTRRRGPVSVLRLVEPGTYVYVRSGLRSLGEPRCLSLLRARAVARVDDNVVCDGVALDKVLRPRARHHRVRAPQVVVVHNFAVGPRAV